MYRKHEQREKKNIQICVLSCITVDYFPCNKKILKKNKLINLMVVGLAFEQKLR